MATICVIGTGYVGLVTGTCLADLGNRVTCLDIVSEKIERLNRGALPIYEPGLEAMVGRNVRAGRLHFTTSYEEGLCNADFVFIAVNTPTSDDLGGADMSFVESAARSIAQVLDHDTIIINKSTMPVGSGDMVRRIIRTHLRRDDVQFAVVSNPEFLREGSAIRDFRSPDRVVLGSTDKEAARQVATLYLPLRAPIVITDLYTAEMIKYASNAFLATKISFINEIARICERLDADVKEVAAGMGYDRRIGRAFLDAGLGYGGSCFGKDISALAYMAEEAGLHPQLLRTVIEINNDQRHLVSDRLTAILGTLRGCTIGVLGLAFKPDTDDMRDAPSIDIIREATSQDAYVRVYDPVALTTGREALEHAGVDMEQVQFCSDSYEAAVDADALVLVTEWREFAALNLRRIRTTMHRPIVLDGRNLFNPDEMRELGFTYYGIGRGASSFHAIIPHEDSTLTQPLVGAGSR